jgi:hypothetical protein
MKFPLDAVTNPPNSNLTGNFAGWLPTKSVNLHPTNSGEQMMRDSSIDRMRGAEMTNSASAANSAISNDCWAQTQSHPTRSNDVGQREQELFGANFSFADSSDIYKDHGTPEENKVIQQMRSTLHSAGAQGDGIRGITYGGAVGHSLDGKVQSSEVHAHAVEAGNTESAMFVNEVKDLVLKGALPSDTWHSNPEINGYSARIFSRQDIEQADVYGLRSYVLTPSGQVIEYIGNRMHTYKEEDRHGKPLGFFQQDGEFTFNKKQSE